MTTSAKAYALLFNEINRQLEVYQNIVETDTIVDTSVIDLT